MQGRAKERSILIAHPGAELYGSDRVTLDSARALTEYGWLVTVTTPSVGPLTLALESLGVEVVVLDFPVFRKSMLSPAGLLGFVRRSLCSIVPALRLLFRLRPDIVYVATLTIPFWIVLGKSVRCTTICHLHEAEVEASRIRRRLLALPVRLCHVVIANSNFALSALEEEIKNPRFRSSVVYNAITLSGPCKPVRELLDDEIELLYVGRLSPRKGGHVAIRAFAQLVDSGINARLRLLGGTFQGYEWYEQRLRDLCRDLAVIDKVQFLGFRSDIVPSLQQADIVVIPSIEPESFGNTAVEAVVAGRPAVVSSTSGLIEAVGGYRSVVMVQPDSPDDLVEALRKIIHEWSRFRANAIESAESARETHSFQHYAEGLEAALQSRRRRTDRRGTPLGDGA